MRLPSASMVAPSARTAKAIASVFPHPAAAVTTPRLASISASTESSLMDAPPQRVDGGTERANCQGYRFGLPAPCCGRDDTPLGIDKRVNGVITHGCASPARRWWQ